MKQSWQAVIISEDTEIQILVRFEVPPELSPLQGEFRAEHDIVRDSFWCPLA